MDKTSESKVEESYATDHIWTAKKVFPQLTKTVIRQLLNSSSYIIPTFLPTHLLQGGPTCSGISSLSSSPEVFHI